MGENIYAERDIMEQKYYALHIDRMTAEGLHDKSAIAAELAHRDEEIESLRARLAELEGQEPVDMGRKQIIDWFHALLDDSSRTKLTQGEYIHAKSALDALYTTPPPSVPDMAALQQAAERVGLGYLWPEKLAELKQAMLTATPAAHEVRGDSITGTSLWPDGPLTSIDSPTIGGTPAPPRSESVVRAEMQAEALERIATRLRAAGATLPHVVDGTLESALQGGLSCALVVIEQEVARLRSEGRE